MAHRKKRSKPSTNLAGDAAIGSHAYKRLDRMILMGLTVPKLIASANIPKPWTLTAAAASYQAGTGSNAGAVRTQAAHNLPADLILNGKPVWTYAQGLDANTNARIKLQIEYSAAATMTVSWLANHLDSQWEKNGLIVAWVDYIRGCLQHPEGLGGGGALNPGIASAARRFLGACAVTLATAITKIETTDTFRNNEDQLNGIFDLYEERVARYDPIDRLNSMWRIYSMQAYR